MAGQIADLAAEQPLLQEDYVRSRPTTKKKKKKKHSRSFTRTTEGSMAKHPGFKAVQGKIAAKEGVSMDRAGAMLASSSRNASPAAKKKNPNLKKVKGKAKSKTSSAKKPWPSSPIASAMGAAC